VGLTSPIAESDVTNLITDLGNKETANANIQAHVTVSHEPANANIQAHVTVSHEPANANIQSHVTVSHEPANANIQSHVISAHAPSNAQKNSDILKSEIEAKLTGAITTHTHSGGADTDKLHIQFFSTQAPTVTGVNPAVTVAVANIGISFLGIGSGAYVRMDGFTTIRLMAYGANAVGQTGTVSIEIYNATNSTSLVILTFNDTTLQIREATASIALTGVKRLYARIKSTVSSDDPLIGDICCMIEK